MSKDSEIAIKVENLHKSFSLAHDKSTSIKSKFVKPFRKNKKDVQKVLDGVSFEIKKGEFFGIVGRNGSGKSTLLKILAGIYTPDKGSVKVNGKLVPFIELGVGFNPELSGRDNVFLNGALLGFSRKEMNALYDEIVDFAELHDHMEKKLKNYSSGMQVRLAFSIAIRAKSDILLIDEVLAVGDTNFQKKCYDYFGLIKNANRTVVLVTHDMSAVEKFCDKAILINNGQIVSRGSTAKVTKDYGDINISNHSTQIDKKNKQATDNNNKNIIVSAEILVNDKKTSAVRAVDKKLTIKYVIQSEINIPKAVFGMYVSNGSGTPIIAANTRLMENYFNIQKGKFLTIKIDLDNIFSNGEYSVSAGVKNYEQTEVYYSNASVTRFIVGGRNHDFALVSPKLKIGIQ